ncbi:MAG: ABC transporter ATP-binding protein [Pseudomonadales bacterium]|nr:ABC transporter ATP-binding protein [Pseudomonadales bacterium]
MPSKRSTISAKLSDKQPATAAPRTDQAIITTRSLCRYYGDDEHNKVKAVDNISIEIRPAEFTAIVGPSGSGKTTLLHLLGGLDDVTSGSVELAGTNIADMSGAQLADFRRDHIGFIFQAYNLIPVLSAAENIEYIMLLQGINNNTRKQRVEQMLAQVGLQGHGNRRPNKLSGGQQQRVAIARAMASKPDIILADEPTANLDSKTGIALLDLMKTLNETNNITFVFSTHDEKIMNRASRLIHIEDGQVIKDENR